MERQKSKDEMFVETKGLSKFLGISEWSVRRYTREGIFPAYRLSKRRTLYKLDEIIEVINKMKI